MIFMKDHELLTPEVRFHLIKKMERHKIIALAGPKLLPHEAKYIEFHQVAGVVLFERNVRSLSQLKELTGAVNGLYANDPPPLIMADHEGDLVAELKRIIGVPPAPMAVAAAGDLALAREVALETGRVMKKIGVNVVLAPVADCFFDAGSAITGLRTFGSDPARVADFVEQTILGFREAGVLACAKHFPGHGSTPDDSHETLPEVRKPLAKLMSEDLLPFRRAVDVGVDLMMMSHVAFPMGGGSLVPASFDARIIKDLLRDQMNYRGAVITDALDMAGARWYARERGRDFTGGFESALLAGVDLLLHATPIPEKVHVEGAGEPVMSMDVMQTIIHTLEKVVDQKKIDQKLEEAAADNEPLRNIIAILDSSDARIAALRAKLAVPPPVKAAPARRSKVIQFDAYPSEPPVYRVVAERSITAWGAQDRYEPLVQDGRYVFIPVEWAPQQSLHKQDLDSFLEVLGRRFPKSARTELTTDFVVGEDGDVYPDIPGGPAVIDATRYTGNENIPLYELPEDAEAVIVFSARGVPTEDFLAPLQMFAERIEPAAVLVTGWPATGWIPDSTPVFLCFGASSQVAAAAAEVLTGEAFAQGNTAGLFPE